MEPILTVTCNEKGGDIDRSVYPFVFSEENIKKFWEQSKKYPQIFGKQTIGTIEDFLNIFFYLDPEGFWKTENLFYVIDDFVGMLSLTNIYHPHDALMHFTFWDGRLRGRENIIKEMMTYVINTYEFNRLSAEIPAYVSKSTLQFVSNRIGLTLEGKKRSAQVSPNGNLVDVLLYGVTKKDIEEWAPQRHKQLVVEQQLL